jgi:hypothetical protein
MPAKELSLREFTEPEFRFSIQGIEMKINQSDTILSGEATYACLNLELLRRGVITLILRISSLPI